MQRALTRRRRPRGYRTPIDKDTFMKVLQLIKNMAVTGNTMNVYAWKIASDAGVSPTFGADEHSFEYSYYCLRSTTDWAGGALAETQQLVYFNRET